MSAYDEGDGIPPIAPIQPINRIQAMRALRVRQTRPYMGDRKAHPMPADSAKASDAPEEEELLAEPAVILDISPQAREQAHCLMEAAPANTPNIKHAVKSEIKRTL